MKKIVKFATFFMVGMFILGMTSCGSKVNQEELNKKIENSLTSDEMPEFTDAEYEFMANYLYDNFDKLNKLDYEDKDAQMAMNYIGILAGADAEGKLNKAAKSKYDEVMEKAYNTDEYKSYKENEKAIMDALQNADIDWDKAFEETEEAQTWVVSDDEDTAEEAVAGEVAE